MPKTYKQLSQEERERIALFKAQGRSLRLIAKSIGRNVSTVSRELERNSPQINECDYLAHRAQLRSDARKAKAHDRKRLRGAGLRAYAARQIRRGWSPERIAGRWKVLGRGQISHEAIYQWIYADARELANCLARAHRRRLRRGHTNKPKDLRIPSRTPINERPRAIEARRQAGHWEADTMIGRGHGSAIQILVERKTRFTKLNKLPAKLAGAMRRAINRSLARYPQGMRRTITYDNGRENVEHVLVNKTLGTRSYFCAPMHSWEKGSVENAAGLVRRRLPKKTDFAIVPTAQIKNTERWLNGLPRKCLGYKTPAEAFRLSVALTG